MLELHMFGRTFRSAATSAAVDTGLRSYMLRVYNYMCGGLLLSGSVAVLLAQYVFSLPVASQVAFFSSPLFLVVVFAPLVLILFMSFKLRALSVSTLQVLYWVFAALMGASFSLALYSYTAESVVRVFFITSGAFAGLSMYGYITRKNLSSMGSFLIMAVWGLVIASIVNMFLTSSMLQFGISVVAVLVFSGLTAYSTQQIKNVYISGGANGLVDLNKAAIMGALSLYINFINLFQALLFLLGGRR